MPQPLAALLKFGERTVYGAWHVLPRARNVDKPLRSAHDIHHVPGIFFLIRRHMKMPARLQHPAYGFRKRGINDAAFVVAAFRPGIGEKQVYGIK